MLRAKGSALQLFGPMSVYCDCVRQNVWYAAFISVLQNIKVSTQIRSWDTCCMLVRSLATKKQQSAENSGAEENWKSQTGRELKIAHWNSARKLKIMHWNRIENRGLEENWKSRTGRELKIMDWRRIENCWLEESQKLRTGRELKITDWNRFENHGLE